MIPRGMKMCNHHVRAAGSGLDFVLIGCGHYDAGVGGGGLVLDMALHINSCENYMKCVDPNLCSSYHWCVMKLEGVSYVGLCPCAHVGRLFL